MGKEFDLLNFADDAEDEIDEKWNPETFSQAVLYGTDWTVKTVIQQIEDGNIDLSPDFQRRDAWPLKNKYKFIESVALQLPIPQIVLAERKEQKGTYIVLDGKQRLITLAQFAANLDGDHPISKQSKLPPPLKLSGLKLLEALNGKTYKNLQEEDGLQVWRTQFDNHTIRSALIRNWPDDNYLYEVFIRLNTGSSKLSPQELRQAMRPGGFTAFLGSASGNSHGLQAILGLDGPDFRMRDVDLLLRLISFYMRKNEYRGNLKAFLDDTQDQLNKKWIDAEPKVSEIAHKIETAINFLIHNFGNPSDVGRRWKDNGFESAINRAVLDVQLASVVSDRNKSVIDGSGVKLSDLTKKLCEGNREFVEAISGTTKSIDAVNKRFGIWMGALSQECGKDLDLY